MAIPVRVNGVRALSHQKKVERRRCICVVPSPDNSKASVRKSVHRQTVKNLNSEFLCQTLNRFEPLAQLAQAGEGKANVSVQRDSNVNEKKCHKNMTQKVNFNFNVLL